MDNIAVIDADLTFNNNHRFPNLALMKIAGYYKNLGDTVDLVYKKEDVYGLLSSGSLFNNILTNRYDKIFVSKVFTDTSIDFEQIDDKRISIGGTGFYFENAPPYLTK